MKMKTMALAVLLLASASTAALAQEGRGRDGPSRGRGDPTERVQGGGGQARGERGQRPAPTQSDNGGQRDRGGWRQRQDGGSQPSVAPQAPAAPQAREAPSAGQDWRQGRTRRGDGQTWPQGRRGGGDGGAGGARTEADRRDAQDWNELDQARRWRGQPGAARQDGSRGGDRQGADRRGADGRGADRRGADQRGADRRGDDRQGGDRSGWNNDRSRGYDGRDARSGWNRGGDRRGDQPRWDRRNYPSVYRSTHRYRGSIYRAPRGFYVRAWTFGEILPSGWYGTEYRLDDWWNYDLPMPPPGFSWVRVGYDVLLIDDYTGRIEQVVRDVFW